MREPSLLTEPRHDAQRGEPRTSDPTTSIVSVVQGFLRNDSGFSGEDIGRYITEALENEARDLWWARVEGLATVTTWQIRADQALNDHNLDDACESVMKRDTMIEAMADRYDPGRTDFVEAVRMTRHSNHVLLSPETFGWMLKLDHDNFLTDALGLDVVRAFRAGQVCNQAPLLPDSKTHRAFLPSRDVPAVVAGARRSFRQRLSADFNDDGHTTCYVERDVA